MKTSSSPIAGCRYCQYYTPEGRRGGSCQQLGVPVKGSWKACSLAIPIFASTWDFQEIMNWQREPLREPLEAETIATIDPVVCAKGTVSPQNSVTPAEITLRRTPTPVYEQASSK